MKLLYLSPNFLNYTEAPIEEPVEAMAPVETGIVDIGTGGADIPIDPIDTEPVIPPFIETSTLQPDPRS